MDVEEGGRQGVMDGEGECEGQLERKGKESGRKRREVLREEGWRKGE